MLNNQYQETVAAHQVHAERLHQAADDRLVNSLAPRVGLVRTALRSLGRGLIWAGERTVGMAGEEQRGEFSPQA